MGENIVQVKLFKKGGISGLLGAKKQHNNNIRVTTPLKT